MKNFLIGCQGTKGNNTDLAYKQLFINFPYRAVFLKDVKNVYKALKNKEIDFALVPIKNSTTGYIKQSKELFLNNPEFNYIKEINIPIHHCLFIHQKGDIKKIKSIASHPQAIMQSRNNLSKLIKNFSIIEELDTSIAAKKLLSGEYDITTGVICRKETGKKIGLQLIKENIEDNINNNTTFYLFENNINV